MKRLTTRGEHRQAWTAANQAIHQLCAGFDEVLAVVHDDQPFVCRQLFLQRVEHRARLHLPDLQGGRERVRQQLALAQGCQLDQAWSVRHHPGDPAGHLEREARLSAAAGAGQRDQARPAEELADLGQLTLPSDKPAGVDGQGSVGMPGGWPLQLPDISRPQGGGQGRRRPGLDADYGRRPHQEARRPHLRVRRLDRYPDWVGRFSVRPRPPRARSARSRR